MQICKENYPNSVLSIRVLYLALYCMAANFAGHPVNNSPKNLYTAFCSLICFTLTPGLFPSWNSENNLFLFIHISRSF